MRHLYPVSLPPLWDVTLTFRGSFRGTCLARRDGYEGIFRESQVLISSLAMSIFWLDGAAFEDSFHRASFTYGCLPSFVAGNRAELRLALCGATFVELRACNLSDLRQLE